MAYSKITVLNHMTYMKKRTAKIQYIILHYAGLVGTTSGNGTARRIVNILDDRIKKDGTKGLSSDFVVDDINILQLASNIDEWRSTAVQSWSSQGTQAGRYATNNNSVSIEIANILINKSAHFTQAVLDNTAYLCKLLISKYNIPKQNIIRHFDINGKDCPCVNGWIITKYSPNDNVYRQFVDSLYSDNSFVPPAPTFEYKKVDTNNTSSGTKSSGNSSSTQSVSVPVSNKVTNLSDVGRIYANQITQLENNRKQAFISMQNSLFDDLFTEENMGDKIHNINPSEIKIADNNLYDSNILKGDQEARKEIIGKDHRKV